MNHPTQALQGKTKNKTEKWKVGGSHQNNKLAGEN